MTRCNKLRNTRNERTKLNKMLQNTKKCNTP